MLKINDPTYKTVLVYSGGSNPVHHQIIIEFGYIYLSLHKKKQKTDCGAGGLTFENSFPAN